MDFASLFSLSDMSVPQEVYNSLRKIHIFRSPASLRIWQAGDASSQAGLTVSVPDSGVTGDLGIPEQQRYIESVEQLEAYKQSIYQQVTRLAERAGTDAPNIFDVYTRRLHDTNSYLRSLLTTYIYASQYV